MLSLATMVLGLLLGTAQANFGGGFGGFGGVWGPMMFGGGSMMRAGQMIDGPFGFMNGGLSPFHQFGAEGFQPYGGFHNQFHRGPQEVEVEVEYVQQQPEAIRPQVEQIQLQQPQVQQIELPPAPQVQQFQMQPMQQIPQQVVQTFQPDQVQLQQFFQPMFPQTAPVPANAEAEAVVEQAPTAGVEVKKIEIADSVGKDTPEEEFFSSLPFFGLRNTPFGSPQSSKIISFEKSTPPPNFLLQSCGLPPGVDSATASYTIRLHPAMQTTSQVGDTVTYTCKDGKILMGPSSVRCQFDGNWSMAPSCQDYASTVCNMPLRPEDTCYGFYDRKPGNFFNALGAVLTTQTRFRYSTGSSKCIAFAGCATNSAGNNFDSEAECMATCAQLISVSTVPAETDDSTATVTSSATAAPTEMTATDEPAAYKPYTLPQASY